MPICRVTSVAFNPFHDQLLISCGSDGRAALWRVSSISSAPLLELGDEDIDPDTGALSSVIRDDSNGKTIITVPFYGAYQSLS